MPSVAGKQKNSLLKNLKAERKSGISLSGSQVNLTPRPAAMASTISNPTPSPSKTLSAVNNNLKKQRPKSAVPLVSRQKPRIEKSRPLSANISLGASREKLELDSPSPASDEISLWMSDEMLQVENKSADSTSTTHMISPFSESAGSSDSEKIIVKQLRFEDEAPDHFVDSVVEQFKEQIRFEDNERPFERPMKPRSKSKKKPKSIAELLEIIDNEIPFELKAAKKSEAPKIDQIKKPKRVLGKITRKVSTVSHSEQTALKEKSDAVSEEVETKMSEMNSEVVEHNYFEEQVPEEKREKVTKIKKEPPNNLSTIFSLLDEVENKEFQPLKMKPLPKCEELDELPKMQGNKQIQILKEALEEKTAHVKLLKETLLQAKVENADAFAVADKEHRIMARKQKLEYEAAIKKLQDGMEKLIADKKSLVDKIEELVQKLRENETKHMSSIQALQQRQTVEIARTKQIAAATEKVRREKWVERQTARIKELTVKGLEPELTRLNLQHESKIAQIQANHSKELQAQVEAEARRIEELRALMLREKDDEVARERTLVSERYERQLAEERAMTEMRCERLREEASAEAARQLANWNAQKEVMISQAWQETQRVQAMHDQQILLLDEKKQAEIAAAKEELREEQATWLTAQNRRNTELLSSKQQELKEQRDREIEKAIEQIEAEERRTRSELERDFEKKLQRLKDQHRAIVADRDLNEKLLTARLNEAQKAMEDSEKQMLSARANEGRLKQELCISEQRVKALEGEHDRIKEMVEKQYSRQIADLEGKILQLKADRETELGQVHARLKGVLEKKDQCIEQLKAQETELAKRCKHLESLLGQ